ncbi:MAG: flagellin [Oscillospiraceae bacterium]
MPIKSINFDAASLSSLRYAKATQTTSAHAQAQMKLGKRIISVQDDASGASIAAGLKARNIAANEGVRNMQETSAALSIAESTLESIADKLNNLKTLAIRARTDLKTTANVQLINNEKSKILAGMSDAVQQAEYNGRKLLTGGVNNAVVNYGLGSITFSISSAALTGLGIDQLTFFGAGANQLLDAAGWNVQITSINIAIERLSQIRGNLGAQQVLIDSTIDALQSNIDRTEEARSTIEDMDALESQVNATTAQSQENLSLQALVLSLQNKFRTVQTANLVLNLLMNA